MFAIMICRNTHKKGKIGTMKSPESDKKIKNKLIK